MSLTPQTCLAYSSVPQSLTVVQKLFKEYQRAMSLQWVTCFFIENMCDPRLVKRFTGSEIS